MDIKGLKKEIQRYRSFKAPIIILTILILANILFILFMVFPLKKSIEVNNREHLSLRTNLNQKLQFKNARNDLEEFHRTLQYKGDFTKIINLISSSVKKNGLTMPTITYQREKTEDKKKTAKDNLYEKTTLTFSVQGGYEGIRRLIYEIESSGYFFIIEDMNLEKKDDKAVNSINLQIRIAAYTR